ncbi:MAG: hypothetical protein IPI67_40320 [Myxococcales bacterium]|nr:hypothetical protein [Myxococcales bacterium]
MTHLSRRAALLASAMFVLAPACSRPAPAPGLLERAELGVFFGGQVQQRKEIPFTLDRTKQTQGFRLTFRQPLRAPVAVHWEIDRPAPKGRGRAVELGDAEARAGLTELDQEIAFRPGDPLGTWNIRVVVDGKIAIDRPIAIYDARSRRRERAALSKR